jgi:peptidyl-prolyl cis-trans isomerase C
MSANAMEGEEANAARIAARSEPVLARPAPSAAWLPRLRGWLREPLGHFLFIGLALFAAHSVWQPSSQAGTGNRIVLTEDDLRQMSVAWLAQGRPPVTPEQMQHLVEQRVREEILYREALALGLDRADTIVRRRLAQKMEFLAEDVASLRNPDPDELRRWFATNAPRFALSPRLTLRHLYFSADRRGERVREQAAGALAKLAGRPGAWAGASALADPFMFQDHYADRSVEQLATLFGPPFARALVELAPGAWQGPIESGYGWHLVWIDSITPGRVPAFEEIEADVKAQWVAEQREEAKKKAFEVIRGRYEIVLPGGPGKMAPAPEAPPPGRTR